MEYFDLDDYELQQDLVNGFVWAPQAYYDCDYTIVKQINDYE